MNTPSYQSIYVDSERFLACYAPLISSSRSGYIVCSLLKQKHYHFSIIIRFQLPIRIDKFEFIHQRFFLLKVLKAPCLIALQILNDAYYL